MKKILQLTTCALFMALSCAAYAENDELALVNRDAAGLREDIVFTLLRKTATIDFLADLAKKPVKSRDGKSLLPFGDLANKLSQEGVKLAGAEKNFTEDPEKRQEIQNLVKERSASGESQIQIMFELFRDNEYAQSMLKQAPAASEQIELVFAQLHDMKETFEGLFEQKFSIKDMENLNTKELAADFNLSPRELEELIDAVYNDEIEQYNKFVEENKDILEKISAFADNGFKIKTLVKKCRTIRKKEFCTTGNEEREIKSLSEIMPYITHLQENPAIEASRSDL